MTAIVAIVDDDPSVCRALKRLVRSAGMDAATFGSGQEFLTFLEDRSGELFACLVVDLQMPGMTGLELQAKLKSRRLPTIFITAHDEPGARAQALEAGAIAFLRKPFNDELLLQTLAKAIAGRN